MRTRRARDRARAEVSEVSRVSFITLPFIRGVPMPDDARTLVAVAVGAAGAAAALLLLRRRLLAGDEEEAMKSDWGSGGVIGTARAEALHGLVSEKKIFDAHCHFYDWMQETEGIEKLSQAMDENGIGYAAITGCSFKKTWVGVTEKDLETPPVHHLYDDGDLYYYSATDGNLYRNLVAFTKERGPRAIARFSMLGCGMNLGDYSCGIEAEHLIENYPMVCGIGELTLQSDDINNVTVKGGNWTYTDPSVKKILAVCARHVPPLPFVFYSDARSVSTKPYREDFEYIKEIDMVCSQQPSVKCLWCGAGVFARGQWTDYIKEVKSLLSQYPNLYISFTPELVSGKYSGITRENALELAESLPGRVVLGTTVRGLFTVPPPAAFGDMSYAEECGHLRRFADDLEERAGKGHAAALRYRTACVVFNLPPPTDPDSYIKPKPKSPKAARPARRTSLAAQAHAAGGAGAGDAAAAFLATIAYGGGGGGSCKSLGEMAAIWKRRSICPPSRANQWDTIDCHLHLLDFLQKSSGTSAALKAMDGCNVKKAVVFGMPCCKKWCFYRDDQPLYYQDDNGPCYVYAFADQMVADAWLALPDHERARIAPCFASFDPTDRAAVSHVKRMYNKYPKMWRGIGEVMCRHDDLTTMMLGKEIPRVDHPGLDPIYKFAVEVGLPVLVHHNSDRVGDNDNHWEYIHEVEKVLDKYPRLKFTWVHAGVSRRCSEPDHHKMIERMCDKYPNMKVDISWVVWEDVICDENGEVKQGWVECIQKHHTKFFIGSDNVAQYFPIKDTSINLLASNITKYYQLFNKLTPAAAQNVAYGNAQREYFDGWKVPSGDQVGTPYARMPSYYETECLDPVSGKFVKGATDLDDDGKY